MGLKCTKNEKSKIFETPIFPSRLGKNTTKIGLNSMKYQYWMEKKDL